MADKQVALIGTKEGPWVCIARMQAPRLKLKCAPGTLVAVHLVDRTQPMLLNEAGEYELPNSPYLRLEVLEGDHSAVLCLILSRQVA